MKNYTLKELLETIQQRGLSDGNGAKRLKHLCNFVLKPGQIYQRSEIIQCLRDFYKDETGENILKETKLTSRVKVIVRDTTYFEKIDRGGEIGLYKFLGNSYPNHVAITHQEEDSVSASTNDLDPEHEYGLGDAEVFGWYLPRYQKTADENGCYPIAISYAGDEGFMGKNKNIIRNLPEKPAYLLRFRCSDENIAKELAQSFCLALKMKNKQITNSYAQNWFQTNWNEIDEIVNPYK